MIRSMGIATAVAGGMVMALATSWPTKADQTPERVLRHLVLYKFKPDLSKEKIAEVVDAFRQLPGRIDAVKGFECGTNVSKEGKSEGFTHAFLVTFADEAGRDEYLVHPAHLEYVQLVKDRREKVVVVDYWTSE